MKTNVILAGLVMAAGLVHSAPAQTAAPAAPPAPPAPPPVYAAPAAPAAPAPVAVYDQRVMAVAPQLITAQQAQTIMDKFKENYAKLGNPRFLIYVNRDLVDEKSGLKVSEGTAQVERYSTSAGGKVQDGAKSSATSTQRVTGNYTYRAGTNGEPTLTDRQTVRDVERLFGRPLRMAGASITDQRVATQLMHDKPLAGSTLRGDSETARKDREAIARLADIVVEVLITSRDVVVPGISSDQTYQAPDIQVTAIRLSDARIMGQASSTDILGKDAARVVRYHDVREITEAVALALMEDMTTAVK